MAIINKLKGLCSQFIQRIPFQREPPPRQGGFWAGQFESPSPEAWAEWDREIEAMFEESLNETERVLRGDTF